MEASQARTDDDPTTGSSAVIGLQRLFQPVAIDWLVAYRMAFGAVICWYAWTFVQSGAVTRFYSVPLFHFHYDGFRWIREIDFPLRIGGRTYEFITVEYLGVAAAALMILLGLCYRAAAVLLALTFTHIFLIDKSYYQNHYYLVCLLAWQLPFLPANRAFALDALLFARKPTPAVPRWVLWLVRFQIGIPYFFGGIAKLDSDWLRGQPMRLSLAEKVDVPLFGGPWFEQEWCVQLFVWGGLLFDLLIVPALLWRRTRLPAYLIAVAFHLANAHVWTIGIFPWLMILITTVFFAPDWPRRFLCALLRVPVSHVATTAWKLPSPLRRGVVIAGLALYATWQCLMPLRSWVVPGNSNWDEYVHRFSWHMLLRSKECGLRIYATDPRTARSGVMDLRSYVTSRQLGVIARDPRMIHELCRNVADDLTRRGFPGVQIRALSLASLNGRRPQLLIDPAVDLAAEPIGRGYPRYVVPLEEPYRHDAWNYPLAEWERHLDLTLPPQMKLPSGREQRVSHDGG